MCLLPTRNRATVCNSCNLSHVCDGVQGVGPAAEIPAPPSVPIICETTSLVRLV